MEKLATIKDVAREAGVSVATVSRVLNGTDRVRSETVEAVQMAIEKLNYHPNFLGRTLRRLETKKILVVLPTISNQFYSRVIRGIQNVAMQQGYHVMLATTESDPGAETEYIEMVRQRLLDGIIFLFSSLPASQLSELAAEYPVVVASETIPGLTGVSSVTIDNRAAAKDAVRFLIENGNRKIAYLSAGSLYGSSYERQLGTMEALSEAGLTLEDEWLLDEGLTYKAGKRAANRLLARDTLPDAVFCAADAAAIGLMHTLLEQDVLAGRDISVMGFDNNSIAEYYNPALTTVAQPQLEIGSKAMNLLLKKIRENAPPEQLLLPHQLVIRDSVKLIK